MGRGEGCRWPEDRSNEAVVEIISTMAKPTQCYRFSHITSLCFWNALLGHEAFRPGRREFRRVLHLRLLCGRSAAVGLTASVLHSPAKGIEHHRRYSSRRYHIPHSLVMIQPCSVASNLSMPFLPRAFSLVRLIDGILIDTSMDARASLWCQKD